MRDSCSVPNEVIIEEVIVAIHDVLNIQSTSIHFTLAVTRHFVVVLTLVSCRKIRS